MRAHCRSWFVVLSACLLVGAGALHVALAMVADVPPAENNPWPMFGGTPQRNMANLVDKNIATDWSIAEGKLKNIKWIAELGGETFGGPVIAAGKVFVGTNNANPRNPKIKKKNMAVLMAFSEADGKFLWQIVHDIPEEEIFSQVMNLGLLSSPTVDGKYLYYVTPSCEVVCAAVDDGKVQWTYDMRKELKVVPLHCGNCSPLVVGERLFLLTSNGRSEGENPTVTSPQAPSFIALDKKSGKLLWQNNLPGANILEGQWSNPSLATVGGKQQIIFPAGDAVVYSFDPDSGKLNWQLNCRPGLDKDNREKTRPTYPIATPVVQGTKIYFGLGVYPEGPGNPPFSNFLCVDITKTGDVSPKKLDPPGVDITGSAVVWVYGGQIQPRPKNNDRAVVFGSTLSTAAVHDGLVYISEEAGYLHCLDAMTGKKYWDHDLKAGIWGSPYYVDGKVYQGADDGSVVIFEAGKKHKVIRQLEMEEVIHGTPVAAHGVLYIGTKSKLYAIAEKQ